MDPVELRPPDHYRLHAEICRVLTEPKRLMLLDALRAGPASVGALADAIGISLPNASQHLAVLRVAGLVEGRRAGTSIAYQLLEPAIVEACRIIDGIVEHRLARGQRSGPADHSDTPGARDAGAVPSRQPVSTTQPEVPRG
jgi:ArsR family transcriptional regulator